MTILNWIAYFIWFLAACIAFLALANEEFILLSMAIGTAIAGTFLFYFGRIVFLLSEIRDALVDEPEQTSEVDEPEQTAEPPLDATKPVRSIEEVSADLKRLKSKV